MKRLSVLLIAALLIILATKSAKADVELTINCGCETSTPTPTPSPGPSSNPTSTPNPTSNPTRDLTPAGAPGCPATKPDSPIVTSIIRKPTSATLTWTKIENANHYLIFYGTKPGSEEFGVPDTGNVTTFTINALNPKLKYYFDVRAVNDCMPSSGQVLGASTTTLAATSSDLTLPRLIISIIAAGITLRLVKKHSI